MKIKRIFAISILMAFAHCLAASGNVIITGNVSAIPDSTVVALFQYEGRFGRSIGMDTVIDGKFSLSVPLDSDLTMTKLRLIKDDRNSRDRTIYLRPNAKIEINASDPYVQTWNVGSDVPEQKEYDRFITESKGILDLLQRDNDFTQTILATSDNNEKDSSESKSNESLRDCLKVVTMLRDMDLLQQMPVSAVWLDKLEDLARTIGFYEAYSVILRERLQNLYNNLDDTGKNSRQGIVANVILNPPTELKTGDIISDEEFIDIDGSQHRLSELRGKWVLLSFWSSGCYASIMAFPELKKFEDENADQAAVVSLSIDNEKMWRFASENYFKIEVNNWNEGKEDMGLYQRFGADGTPTFVLISPEGEIKAKWMLYGQGSLGRQFKLHSRGKGQTEYSEIKDVTCVRNPEYDYNETIGMLDVEGVEMSENGIKIEFFANDTPGTRITISPESFLITDDGTRLKLTGSEGLTPGQEFNVDENGTSRFSLMYEPLPKETQFLTYVEKPGSYLSIKNIRVKQ